MLKNWLSHYSWRYPRSLIYMLQSTEYSFADYLAWYKKVKDFNKVENRKKLVYTPKSVFLLISTQLLIIALYGASLATLRLSIGPIKFVFCLAALALTPYLLTYLIILPLWLIKLFIQKPAEYFIIKKACQKLAEHPGLKIGIAGSFGKTSMREILKTVLAEGKTVAAPPHSYNRLLGISQFVETLTGKEEVLIFELGEYAVGDIKKLCQLTQPDIGIITGVNEAHLSNFKTIDRSTKTIFELAEYLKDKPVYINAENNLAKSCAQTEHILYSREQIGNLKITNQKTDLTGTSFTLIKNNNQIELRSNLLGLHQIGPLALAAQIALDLNLSIDQIKNGIRKTKPFDHRLEPKTDSSGIVILDDSYNGNPDGVKAVIDFLQSLKNNRRIYVTPGLVEMGSQTKAVHLLIGKQLAEAEIEKVILIKNSVTPFIEQGLKNALYQGEIIWFNEALAAFAALPHLTVKGDVVLLQNDWPDQYH